MSPTAFVNQATQDGLTEVELGKLAENKTQDENVRSFAQRMVQDHSAANSQLAQLAESKGIAAPTEIDAAHHKVIQGLSAKSGAAFDSAYASLMASAHTKAVALFTSAAKSSDPAIAQFAKNTLPTLEEHQHMADQLRTSTRTAATGHKGATG
jgi:putative membrane protein